MVPSASRLLSWIYGTEDDATRAHAAGIGHSSSPLSARTSVNECVQANGTRQLRVSRRAVPPVPRSSRYREKAFARKASACFPLPGSGRCTGWVPAGPLRRGRLCRQSGGERNSLRWTGLSVNWPRAGCPEASPSLRHSEHDLRQRENKAELLATRPLLVRRGRYAGHPVSYDLRITGPSLERFARTIGFSLSRKNDKATKVVEEHAFYREDPTASIVDVTYEGPEVTYNLTEPFITRMLLKAL